MKVLCQVVYTLNDDTHIEYFTIPLPAAMDGPVLNGYVRNVLLQHFNDLNVDLNLFEDSRRYKYELHQFEILTGSILEL